MKSEQQVADQATSSATSSCSLILRLLAVAATLTAATVMGLDKETKTVEIALIPIMPPMAVTATAKFSYSSAFVYFVVANAIACFYSLASLILSFTSNKGKKTNLLLPIAIADMLILVLLFSGNAAAMAVGVVGEKGMPKVGWNKVCNNFTKFCAHVMASVAVSLVACLAYLVLMVLQLVGLQKKSPN